MPLSRRLVRTKHPDDLIFDWEYESLMADKVSSYRRWLGLAHSSVNYFQLLGIDRGERRPDVLRASAEARLELLKSFRGEEGLEERKALAAEIKLALATLSDPAKRQTYEQKQPPPLGITNSQSTPPLAIPVAVPIAQPLPESAPPPARPNSPVESACEPSDPLAKVALLEAKKNRRQRSRSRSWLLPAVGLLLFLGGPLLIAGAIWFNSRDRLVADEPETKPATSVAKEAATPPRRAKPNETSPFVGLTPKASSETEPMSGDQGETGEVSDTPEGKAPAIEPGAGEADPSPSPNESGATPVDAAVAYASPKVQELSRVIWNDLRYRETATARKRLLLAKSMLTTPQELAQLAALEEFTGHVERYWKQLAQSAAKLRTGEIKWGGELAGFVSSTDQYVMVKLKGVSLKVAWEYLPPLIAAQLAEQAPIADLPTWRLAKTAALMLDPRNIREQEALIRQWLDESAADGKEIENLLWVLERRKADAQLVERSPIPSGEQLKQARQKLQEVLPEQRLAQNNVAGQKLAIEQLLDEAGKQADLNLKFAALERAREHAIRLVDLPLCRELIEAMATRFEMDIESLMLESANEMAPYVRSPQQAELVCEAILDSAGVNLHNFVKGTADPKVLRTAEELSRKQELKMMLDRIHFLTGRN